MNLDRLVPMHWPCGPLAIERPGRQEPSPGERECLEHWSRPEALDLLDGTPVSALVIPWADGSPGDEPHQRALGPLVAAARGCGLAVIGATSAEADLERAAAGARKAGLGALATESEDAEAPRFPILRFRGHRLPEVSAEGFLGVTDSPWPGMKTSAEGTYDAWTGPTGPPWIDSNAWYVRLARELTQPRTVWLSFDPPADEPPPAAEAYEQAVADSAVYGGRWVISLDDRLRAGLSSGRPDARETWGRIARSLSFFEEHSSWAAWRPDGPLGVVSDFAGANERVSFEVLSLLSRRNLLYRILEKGRAREASLDGLAMLLYLDEPPPTPDLARRLDAFVEGGGTLVTPPGWDARGSPDGAPPYPGFRAFRHGSGRVAVADEAFVDPFLVVESVFGLSGHAHDWLRVFNPGVSQFHYLASEDGRAAVVHVIRHSRRAFETQTSVWFRRPWESARQWYLAPGAPKPAEREPRGDGVEFHLPPVPAYCAVEVSA